MRIKLFIAILAVIFMLHASQWAVNAYGLESNGKIALDGSRLSKGVIGVINGSDYWSGNRISIEKDGIKYWYYLRNSQISEYFPLQMGNGKYRICISKVDEGNNSGKLVYDRTVDLDTDNPGALFLSSVQNIEWDESFKAIKKARELTLGVNTDKEKILLIYNFITENVKYDFDKYETLKKDYVPDIDNILNDMKGICYDFSSLFAAMLRSVGVQVKLVKGYSNNVKGYHAWNEVYLVETGSWVVVDTSYDSQLKDKGRRVEMIKKDDVYRKVREY